MPVRPVFNLNLRDCASLRGVNRAHIQEVRRTLAPIVGRIFGFNPQRLEQEPAFKLWVGGLLRQNFNLTLAILTIQDQVDGKLAQDLIKDLIIGKTSFFRHKAQHDLMLQAFDRIFVPGRTEPVRIWVPGCSSGDEAYTIAMIFKKQGYTDLGIPIEIVATDLSAVNIEQAKAGSYYYLDSRDTQMDTGTTELIEEHREFISDDGQHYHVDPSIKSMVDFKVDNLLYPRVEGVFDVVSCHHVLQHLTNRGQKQAVSVILDRIKPNGYLVSQEKVFDKNQQLKMLREPEPTIGYTLFIKQEK